MTNLFICLFPALSVSGFSISDSLRDPSVNKVPKNHLNTVIL